MRRLILFRHAKAEARASGEGDLERPLAQRGRVEAGWMGGVARDQGLIPDLALVSPSLRTRETWLLASEAFPTARMEIRDGLYDATPEEIMAEVETVAGAAEAVMVVGHNPGLQELAMGLLADGGGPAADVERVSAAFPTATVAALRIDGQGEVSLEALLLPRDLAGRPGS